MTHTFVMAGGGTGGHVVPGLAVARELRRRGHQCVFIGTRRGIEARLVPAENFAIEWIEVGALNRVGFARQIRTLAGLPIAVWKASRMIDRLKPAAIFSMGGFAAGPPLLGAVLKGVPIVAMEPNAIAGFTHRKLSRFVTRALLSFEETARFFPPGRSEVTGLPVRGEFFAAPPIGPGAIPTILITGGSQGSRTLNRAVEESWPLWGDLPIRIIHQTGAQADLSSKFAATGLQGEVMQFTTEMPAKFGGAALIVCRAGAGTLAELAAAGRASILVPLPRAADDHQRKNAAAFERAGAARVIADSEMSGRRLVEEVRALTGDRERLERMGEAARRFARPDAAARAADIVEEIARRREIH